MKESPVITKIEAIHYSHTLNEVGRDYNTFNMVYEPGGTSKQSGSLVRIHTDQGLIGEYPDVNDPTLAEIKILGSYLIGKNALAREPIYNDLKRGSRPVSYTHLRAHET